MRTIARTDSTQAPIVCALRAAGCLVHSFHQAGGGVPDLLVFRATPVHRWALLEVKVSRAKTKRSVRLTPAQIEFTKLWPVSIVTNEQEALEAMGFRVAA